MQFKIKQKTNQTLKGVIQMNMVKTNLCVSTASSVSSFLFLMCLWSISAKTFNC